MKRVAMKLVMDFLESVGRFLNSIPYEDKATPEEVADIIDRFVEQRDTEWEWDDFTSVGRYADPLAQQAWIRVSEIAEKYPALRSNKSDRWCSAEGIQKLRELAAAIREGKISEL